MIRGTKKCCWLPIGSLTRCGKSSINDYCGVHAAIIKRYNHSGPRPCLVCQRGVKGPVQLCGACGGNKYRSLQCYYKSRSPKYYQRGELPSLEQYIADHKTENIKSF